MQHCFLLSRKSLWFLGSAMGIAIANRKNCCDFGALRITASMAPLPAPQSSSLLPFANLRRHHRSVPTLNSFPHIVRMRGTIACCVAPSATAGNTGSRGGLFRKVAVYLSHWKLLEPRKQQEPRDEILKATPFKILQLQLFSNTPQEPRNPLDEMFENHPLIETTPVDSPSHYFLGLLCQYVRWHLSCHSHLQAHLSVTVFLDFLCRFMGTLFEPTSFKTCPKEMLHLVQSPIFCVRRSDSSAHPSLA